MFYADNGPVYTMRDLPDFVAEVKESGMPTVSKKKGRQRYDLFNVPCSFDIETTSYKIDGETKVAWMYIWMFGINGISIYGRTWEEFILLMSNLEYELGISLSRRLVCYTHNLGYEFQYMRHYFEWEQVFAIKERTPLFAITTTGIEFRCSYMLTGTKLEKVGEDLLKYKCEKKVGDLDYSLIRGPKTPITEQELGYCINDIRVVMCKIMECIESENNNIGYIPLTKTGYVRRDVRKAVKKDEKTADLVASLTIETKEFKMLKSAFQGGFTHANVNNSNMTLEDVVSYDFTSSYPTIILSEKVPMGKGRYVNPQSYEEFMGYLQNYCCLMTIKMTNVVLKDGMGDAPISLSKCVATGSKLIDNGRVREADELITTITDVDFMVYRRFYKFEYEVGDMIIYPRAYFPKPFIEKTLEYYVKKTTLKDVEGKEEDYQLAKANLNSIYGMMCSMAEFRPEIVYDEEWLESEKVDDKLLSDLVEKYNDAKNRFTWMPWAVWITAYARRNLFSGIYECGEEDYIYSDTDSIKILNCSEHEDYILEYNRNITEKLSACLEHYGLDTSLLCPETVEGKKKPLGVWDFDGHYKRFKTLGAKRYLVETDDGTIKATIAGVGKKAAAKYLSKDGTPFEDFKDGVKIPAGHTDKNTHTYIDDQITVTFEDMNGVQDTITVLSCIHMEEASFTIGLSTDYCYLLKELGLYDSDMYA